MYVGRYQPLMTMPLNSCVLGLDVMIVVVRIREQTGLSS